MINRKKFYDQIRPSKLFKVLSQSQFKGIEAILNEWESRENLTDLRWLAYMLATVYHETAKEMIPVRESGKGMGRRYGRKVKRSGVPYTIPDEIYYGRGGVQLTWYENYENMGRLLGIDLLNNPDLALQPEVSVKIMFEGMTKGDSSFGDFTGKSLEDYFNDKVDDPVNARRIINGIDKAGLISGYYKFFLNALKKSSDGE